MIKYIIIIKFNVIFNLTNKWNIIKIKEFNYLIFSHFNKLIEK